MDELGDQDMVRMLVTNTNAGSRFVTILAGEGDRVQSWTGLKNIQGEGKDEGPKKCTL